MVTAKKGRGATAAIVAAALGALLATGCSQLRPEESPASPLGRLVRTNPSAAPAMGTPEGAGRDDVNPVHPVERPEARTAAPAPRTPPPSTSPLTRPEKEARHEPRLGDVPLPEERKPTPLLTPASAKDKDKVFLVDTVLAQVNDEVITREDVLGGLRSQIDQWRKELSPQAFEDHYRYVVEGKLREAINQRLAVQEAKRVLTEDEKKGIDAILDKTLKTMIAEAGSRQLLELKLAKQGSTIDGAMQKERDRMMVQRFLHQRIAPSVHVTHSELLKRYGEVRQERYVKPTRVHLRLITVKKSEFATPQDAKAAVEAVYKRIKADEDFGRLAERHSHDVCASKGGDWGFVTQGAFRVKAVDEAIFALAAGQVAPLIETPDAWYIAKVQAREEGRTVPFTEVQDQLEDELRDKQFNETVAKYIQDLYKRAYVRIIETNL